MRGELLTDYNGNIIQAFVPEKTFIEVTSLVAVNTTNILCFCVDQNVDIYFNGSSTPTYNGWPAHRVLGVGPDIISITFSVDCVMMYMAR